jgi:four helix bundle protein
LQDFRDLKVWQKAHALTLAIYTTTREFPKEEVYGLTGQMRRAAASIAANLAEGCCRSGDTEFARFAQIAMGSASELKYYPLLAQDLHLIDSPAYTRLFDEVNEVQRMLASLIGVLKQESPKKR